MGYARHSEASADNSTATGTTRRIRSCKRHSGHADQKNMLHGYIIDPETGKKVAVIRHGEVFRDDKEGARIAIVINANLYDLRGNLVGRLDGQHVIDVRTRSMPIAFRNLLEGEGAHHPVPTVKQKGRFENRPSGHFAAGARSSAAAAPAGPMWLELG
jgi:hypothetical protein